MRATASIAVQAPLAPARNSSYGTYRIYPGLGPPWAVSPGIAWGSTGP